MMVKHKKFFEMCSVALILACLRTCSCEEKSSKGLQTEFFCKHFEDKTISIVRTRRPYSYDPVRWENPIPYDEGIFEKPEYISMSKHGMISWFGTAFCKRKMENDAPSSEKM